MLQAHFVEAGSEMHLRPGAMLWQEGERGDFAVLLVEGQLEVIRETEDGEVIVLSVLPPGSVLGEMSCMEGGTHSATVRAAVACRLRRLSAESFRGFARQHPQVLEALLLEQNHRLRAMSRHATNLAFESVVQRVARYLLRSQSAQISITHQELAERVAATRESVTKALGALSRQGCVSLGRGTIRLLDMERLQQLV